jgi:phospholipid/cholesterol/gamma-HCH transport system permease protein
MLNILSKIGKPCCTRILLLGQFAIFFLRILLRKPKLLRILPIFLTEMHVLGTLSLLIMLLSSVFVGMVIGIQAYHTLQKFGALSELGPLLALSVVRELGPVMSGLLFAGRVGTALTAEIGLMKATEQLDSLEMMGVDTYSLVVYPRFMAGIIVLPLLSIIFAAFAIYGGYFIAVYLFGLDAGSFWANMQSQVDFRTDIMSSIIKSAVFAILILWIALFQGINAEPTAEGISYATTRTVVQASVAIFAADLLLTTMMIGDW